ncbi:UBX domain protein [Necator americanus]|uniref:UBX domain protein n=1 Tax=Necator americanus TaxID=51031 RepID=W2T7X9_NECAM|nr:UBX domain protein [Necator americanus]ETN77988.1 UBX domain protein [Necator americanus]
MKREAERRRIEVKAIAEERRRAKQEEAEARQRVLDQIKADREARKAGKVGVLPASPPQPTAPPVSATPTAKDYNQTTIQVRLLNGQAVRQTFGALEPLSAVRLWLELNHSDGSPFTLLQPFPRKLMTDEDYEKPLKELGLVPSANFVMTR